MQSNIYAHIQVISWTLKIRKSWHLLLTTVRELLIKETLLIQEQQPEINVDNFSTRLYLFRT